MEKQVFKFFIALSVIIALIFSCGESNKKSSENKEKTNYYSEEKSNNNVESGSDNEKKEYAKEEKLPKIGEVAVNGDASLKVISVKDCSSTLLGKPEPGNKYIDVCVVLENRGSENLSYNCLGFSIEDNEGYSYDYAFTSCGEPGFSAGDLRPKQKRKGYVAFEVPKGNKAAKLMYKIGVWGDEEIIVDLSSK